MKAMPILAAVALALPLALPATAQADTYITPAAGSCKSALPIFDGNIRTRPRAVQNEGTAPAFVTCAQQADNGDLATGVSIYLLNTGPAAVDVTCTLVVGMNSPSYYTATLTLPAASYGSPMTFADLDPVTLDGNGSSYSCQLPPGAGVSRLHLNVADE